ncbi:MAG TPA: LptF/LptG family permease [Gemmatimonadaceae bacterium]|nr:LptF/LptG family permease [Gemmatimonadaceae bacterium]
MKIISRYVLKEHVGPFVFAISALTSLMLLQYIARRFGDLVGRGLSWQVITEFFLLSIPFTVAMTLPMAVLVSVLYAFSRLASENEITALKAGGVSTRALMRPALLSSIVLAFFMLWFNDQVLSRANHELATLQMAIFRTKPTFALKEQVINTVKEGQLYLRAGYIDRDQNGRMRDVTIYDVSDARRRRTIYADSGTLQLAPNRRDLLMHLYHGLMMSAPTNQSEQLDRIYYAEDQLKVRDVANSFQTISSDTSAKGEREMSVCEMQAEFESRHRALQRAYADSVRAVWRVLNSRGDKRPEPPAPKFTKAGGIGAMYCQLIKKYFRVQTASAAELPRVGSLLNQQDSANRQDTTSKRQDTTSKRRDTTAKAQDSAKAAVARQQDSAKSVVAKEQDSAKAAIARQQDSASKAIMAKLGDSVWVIVDGIIKHVARAKIPPGAFIPETTAASRAAKAGGAAPVPGQPGAPAGVNPATIAPVTPGAPVPSTGNARADTAAKQDVQSAIAMEVSDAKIRIDDARHWRNRYGVEIQKKFSLAAACIVFVLVGAPIALRFPRGGVGLVIGVSFVVFAIYYVGLIGGESLANHSIISPFWAMWADNILFLIVGLILVARMGHEGVTSRGGNLHEMIDATRAWFARLGKRGRAQREATVS